MKKGSKRILAIALAAVLTVSQMAGCSSASSSSAQSSGTTGSGSAGTGEKKVISVLVSGVKATGGNDFTCDILPTEVKKLYPDITIEAMKLPDDQYYTSLKTKLASGEAPDIIWVQPRSGGPNGVIPLAKAGYLADLSDLNFWDKIQGTGKEDMSYDGKPYAVTSGVAMLGVYYNKNVFEKNSIAVPTDWGKFLGACEKLKSNGITPIVMGDKDAFMMQFGLYQIAANQVYPANKDFDTQLAEGKTKFTDSSWETTLNMYKTLYDKGYVNKNSLALGQAQSQQQFVDGQAAMTFDGTFSSKTLENQGTAKFDRGFFALPANDPGNTTYVAGATGAGFAVYSKSKYIKEIKDILNTMCDGKSDLFKAWSTDQSYISTYKDVPLQDPLFTDALKLYNSGNSFYWCNQMWPAGVAEEMESKFGEIIGNQGTTVEQTAQAMQAKFEELNKS